VPGEVSVVGFDNAPQSAFYAPALTTVELDFTGLGRACFALLHDAIGKESTAPPPPPVPRPRLVTRESAGVHHPASTAP
jgi:DNA-binding LacI/PurR family transcriptional regulator